MVLVNRTYAVGVFAFGRAIRYLLFVVRFFARRAKKRTTDKMGSTMLPQAKRRLSAAPRKSCG
jgi:hypothetical protein